MNFNLKEVTCKIIPCGNFANRVIDSIQCNIGKEDLIREIRNKFKKIGNLYEVNFNGDNTIDLPNLKLHLKSADYMIILGDLNDDISIEQIKQLRYNLQDINVYSIVILNMPYSVDKIKNSSESLEKLRELSNGFDLVLPVIGYEEKELASINEMVTVYYLNTMYEISVYDMECEILEEFKNIFKNKGLAFTGMSGGKDYSELKKCFNEIISSQENIKSYKDVKDMYIKLTVASDCNLEESEKFLNYLDEEIDQNNIYNVTIDENYKSGFFSMFIIGV